MGLIEMPAWNEPTSSIQTVEENCCICLQELQENVLKTNCKHKFHKECLSKWLDVSRVCPLCKRAIKLEDNDVCDDFFQLNDYRDVQQTHVEESCFHVHICFVCLFSSYALISMCGGFIISVIGIGLHGTNPFYIGYVILNLTFYVFAWILQMTQWTRFHNFSRKIVHVVGVLLIMQVI